MPGLKAIRQPQPLAKLAFESLRDSILNGRLESGSIYNEKVLAGDLGISKTPVREALLELAAQGLVTFLPRRGVMVNRFSEKDIEDIFEIRLVIEVAMAEKIAKAPSLLDLGRVDQALADQDKAVHDGDLDAFVEADRRLHLIFGEAVQNSRMATILENVRDLIHVIGKSALMLGSRPGEVVEEHRRIVETIRSGDPEKARRAMAEHIEDTRDRVLRYYRKRPTQG